MTIHIINRLFIILSLLVTQLSYGQKSKNDTIFFQNDTVEPSIYKSNVRYTFIDPNRHSKYYKDLVRFRFGEFDDKTYGSSLEYLKDKNEKLTKKNPDVFATKWVILQTYHNNFYVYYPCDFYNYFKQSINDTTFIDWTGEGPIANKIIDARAIDSSTYFFQLAGQYHHERKLIIHIIDRQRGIAVFEEIDSERGKSYKLMIAADKIKTVPIVLTRCYDSYSYFGDFDDPDFEKLLKKK